MGEQGQLVGQQLVVEELRLIEPSSEECCDEGAVHSRYVSPGAEAACCVTGATRARRFRQRRVLGTGVRYNPSAIQYGIHKVWRP